MGNYENGLVGAYSREVNFESALHKDVVCDAVFRILEIISMLCGIGRIFYLVAKNNGWLSLGSSITGMTFHSSV